MDLIFYGFKILRLILVKFIIHLQKNQDDAEGNGDKFEAVIQIFIQVSTALSMISTVVVKNNKSIFD